MPLSLEPFSMDDLDELSGEDFLSELPVELPEPSEEPSDFFPFPPVSAELFL